MGEIKKRFIAGAVCPRCSEMDKLVVYRLGDKDYRECVSCDFSEEMLFSQPSADLETRANRNLSVEAVRIIEPMGGNKSN